jgi:hypothetical protein
MHTRALAEEDLQQLGKRKRKPKSSAAAMAGTEDEYEGGGTSPMVGGRAPQRRAGGGMGGGPARGSLADTGDEGPMPGGRAQRKRKVPVGVGVGWWVLVGGLLPHEFYACVVLASVLPSLWDI